MRADGGNLGDNRIVRPKSPSFGQTNIVLTSSNVSAERGVGKQPVTDRRIKPKNAGGRILEADDATTGSNKCKHVPGAGMKEARAIKFTLLSDRRIRDSTRVLKGANGTRAARSEPGPGESRAGRGGNGRANKTRHSEFDEVKAASSAKSKPTP